MGKRERKISKFTGRWITEQGAGTVEYVIVVLVAIVIGAGLLAFGNQVSGQVTKTGGSISSWFSKANGTGGTGGGNAGGGGGGTDSRIEELKENPALADVPAIRDGRITSVTLCESFASSMTGDTIEKFARSFHPDCFQ